MITRATNAAGQAHQPLADPPNERRSCSPGPEPDSAELEWATMELGVLARYVDSLSTSPGLRRHPALCAQLRRAALEALASASNASGEPRAHKRRHESLRALGALYELDVISRIARHTGALRHTEEERLSGMHRRVAELLRTCLDTGEDHV